MDELMPVICPDQKWSHGRGFCSGTSQFHENERYLDKILYYPYSNMHFEEYFGQKNFFIVHNHGARISVKQIGEFPAQFLIFSLVSLCILEFYSKKCAFFSNARPIVVWLTRNVCPRRCWLTPVRLLTNRFSLLRWCVPKTGGRPVLKLSFNDPSSSPRSIVL